METELTFQDIQNKFDSVMKQIDKHKQTISNEINDLKKERLNLDKTILECETMLGIKL